jgi:hypothetical protein
VNRATYNRPIDKWDGNLNVAAPTHVNTHTTHTRCARRGIEGCVITAKCSQIDGACRVYPQNWEMSRPGSMEAENAIEQNKVITSASSYS